MFVAFSQAVSDPREQPTNRQCFHSQVGTPRLGSFTNGSKLTQLRGGRATLTLVPSGASGSRSIRGTTALAPDVSLPGVQTWKTELRVLEIHPVPPTRETARSSQLPELAPTQPLRRKHQVLNAACVQVTPVLSEERILRLGMAPLCLRGGKTATLLQPCHHPRPVPARSKDRRMF